MKKLRYIALIITLCFSNALMGQEYIQMTRESGIYTIPCEVNGHKLRFIFDTGAADVHLSYAEASYMFKNGYLSKHDIVGTKKYVMADGTKVENTTIILKTLKIGNIVLKDVKASISQKQDAQLLLGQSAISRLGVFTIKDDYLIIKGENIHTSPDGARYKETRYYTGGKYVGQCKDGKRDGEGTFYYKNGKTYVGSWKDDKKNGFGKETFASGSRYEGYYKNNKKDGNGTYYSAGGDKYVGYWKEGKRNGEGTLYYSNGEKFVGHWKDDQKNGFGKETFASGARYEGYYKNNKRNGEGTMYYANGDKYVGNWKDDKKDGEGIYYYANGTKRDMVFQEGVRITGNTTN